MIYALLIFLHIFVSIGLIVSVLLQSSKGGGLSGTFGGSGITGGVFGGRGAAPFLTKATTAFAILFMLTSISLNYVRPGVRSDSVIERSLLNNTGSGTSGSAPAVTDKMPVAPIESGDEQSSDNPVSGTE